MNIAKIHILYSWDVRGWCRDKKEINIGPFIRGPLAFTKVHCSEGPFFRRSDVLKVRCSEGPLFRGFIAPKVRYSEIKVHCTENKVQYSEKE